MTVKRWRVRLMQTVIEEAWVTVDAGSEDEALRMAEHYATTGQIETTWAFVECRGDIEAVHVEEQGRITFWRDQPEVNEALTKLRVKQKGD